MQVCLDLKVGGITSSSTVNQGISVLKLVINVETVAAVVDRASQLYHFSDMAYKRMMERITRIREEQQKVEQYPK